MATRADGLTIGEVIALLRDEFPELTVSKLRFLEGEGLVDPARSGSGYRVYGDEDVRRIRYILREQRDHYLPLKVIKSKLTAWERGESAEAQPESGPPPEAYFATSGVSLLPAELSRSTGLTSAQIDELVDYGVLEPMELPNGEKVFRDEDLAIGRAAARLFSRGLEGRHVRAIRLSVDREIELVQQLVTPLLRHRNPENRRRAAEILADCGQAAALLSEEMAKTRLRRLLET